MWNAFSICRALHTQNAWEAWRNCTSQCECVDMISYSDSNWTVYAWLLTPFSVHAWTLRIDSNPFLKLLYQFEFFVVKNLLCLGMKVISFFFSHCIHVAHSKFSQFVSSAYGNGKFNKINVAFHALHTYSTVDKRNNNGYALLFNGFCHVLLGVSGWESWVVRRRSKIAYGIIIYRRASGRRWIMRSVVICLCVFTLGHCVIVCYVTHTHSLSLFLALSLFTSLYRVWYFFFAFSISHSISFEVYLSISSPICLRFIPHSSDISHMMKTQPKNEMKHGGSGSMQSSQFGVH